MADRLSLRKALLWSLIGALLLSALVGIYIFVMGDFGRTEMKVLATTLSLTYFSVTSLACTFVLERRRAAVGLAAPGLVLSVWGFLWSLAMIWPEWETEFAGKTMVILVLLAFSFAQSSLLALARLGRQWLWVFVAALGCISALAILLSVIIIIEAEDEFLFRVAGVLGILDATGTLSVPILHKLGGKPADEPRRPAPPAEPSPEQDWRIDLACPRCGYREVHPAGLIVCPKCSLAVRVEVVPGQGGPGRRPFQFSLKTMLLVFLAVSLPLGWVGFRIGQLRAQAAVVERLKDYQPQLFYQFGNLYWVSFASTDPQKFDASVLGHLKELPKLRRLELGGMPVTDADLAHLEGMRLEQIELGNTQITDAGLVYLQGMSELDGLDVSNTQITDAGLLHLEGLSHLEHVNLSNTQITDAGLVCLEGLSHLEYVNVSNTPVTAQGATRLEQKTPNLYVNR